MKIASDVQQGFKPVTFTITVESEEELIALWQRFDINTNRIIDSVATNGCIDNPKFKEVRSLPHAIWSHIDEVCKSVSLDYSSNS